MIPTTIFEENEKNVNRVYLATLAQGIFELTPIQLNEISPVAHQCVNQGGRGVLLARLLYQLYESKFFNDEDLCTESPSLTERNSIVKSKDVSVAENIKIYPNPNQGTFTISIFDKKLEGKLVTAQLFSPTGKLVLSKLINGNQKTEINTVNLPKGIYYCIIKNSDKIFATEKVIILKN